MRRKVGEFQASNKVDIQLSGNDVLIFKNYTKLKVSLIIYNIVISLLALIIFGIVFSRLMEGIKQPWLFKYAFSDAKVFHAVHNVEKKYQPDSLKYVDVIYIILPLYLWIVYIVNAVFIITGTWLKNFQLLYLASNVSLSMNCSVCILMIIFGVIMNNLVDDYLIKWNQDFKITKTEFQKDKSIAKLIIVSYVTAFSILLMAISVSNYYATSKLTKLMKYYLEQKIEQQEFVPLPYFLSRTHDNTQIGDSVEIVNASNKSEEV